MNIEVENFVTFHAGDGITDAYVIILNIICTAKNPKELIADLKLKDEIDNIGYYFKWGFGRYHFWLHQRLTPGSDEVKKERVLISRF